MRTSPMRFAFLAALLVCFSVQSAAAKENKTITTAGTGIAIALPVVAAGITAYKRGHPSLARHRPVTLRQAQSEVAHKRV